MPLFSRRQLVRTAIGAGTFAGIGLAAGATDVTETGARGDGQADDTAAIQQAVNAGRGTVYFPKGIYRLTRTVVIDLDAKGYTSLVGDGTAQVVMAGGGPAFHFIGTHDGTADPETMRDEIWTRQRLPIVTGFEIVGDHPEAVGVRLEGTVQATLAHLLVRQCRTGLHFVKRNRNPIISHCHVYQNREIGIDFDNVNLHQAIIADSHISYNAQAGVRLVGGNMRNFQLVGNDIEYNYDFERDGCADVLIDMTPAGSSFREGTIVGNTIQAKPSPGGANIRFIGGKHPHTGGMCAITGNFISNQTDNVHLAHCRMVTVSGNALCSAAGRTMRIERCAAVVIGDNAIDWNPVPRGKELADGIAISDCKNVTISNTIIENSLQPTEGAIDVKRSEDVAITNCQVLDPKVRGITMTDVTRCRVSTCTIVDRRAARLMRTSIEITGASRDNLVADNIINTGSLAVDEDTAIIRDNIEVKVEQASG